MLKHKTGQALETCVQLVIDATVEVVTPRPHPMEYCPVCKISRFELFRVGFFPKPATEQTAAAMVKSTQYFGTGHASYKQIMVSHDLYVEIERHGLKGIEWGACAE